jgi:putative membrane protein
MPVTDTTPRLTEAYPQRNLAGLAGLYLRGLLIGATDIVPGVSGGTTALLLGIYHELLASLKALSSTRFLGALRRLQLREAFAAVNGTFLLVVLAGVATSILTLAQALAWLLENRPVFVAAFFFGLVLASVVVVMRQASKWTVAYVLVFLAGAAGAWLLVGLSPAVTPDAWWFLLLSGALAVCALLLPGISGAFVLLLLGKYQFALNAVARADLAALGTLILGGVLGLVSFSRLLTWLFRRHHDLTIALMAGFMLGSLRRLWPWQSETEGIAVNHLPDGPLFDLTSGAFWAILLLVGAIAVVFVMERLALTRPTAG